LLTNNPGTIKLAAIYSDKVDNTKRSHFRMDAIGEALGGIKEQVQHLM
jgi:hypothetical protein